jgi:DNA-binding NtrC family response regulator
VALIDLGLPPVTNLPVEGFKLVGDLLAWSSAMRIFVLTGQNEESHARRARALGASELVPKPCEPEHLRRLLKRAVAESTLAAKPSAPLHFDHESEDETLIIGESAPMRKLKSQIDLYAASTFPALIVGESGSGKERVAAALHGLSARASLPFLALNCAAISASLVEPTLFGHAKGAFTGANAAKTGYFEDAGEGTLFLDEIGELPLELQPKLLRVLENGEYQRVGETTARVSRARVVAATNRDLRAEVKAGRFRADLFHRLSVLSIGVPPLRELGRDKLALLAFFSSRVSRSQTAAPFRLSAEAESLWLRYDFPGNVRELRNVVIRLIAKHAGHEISANELRDELDPGAMDANADVLVASDENVIQQTMQVIQSNATYRLDDALAHIERQHIEAAIRLAEGNMSQAARILGVSRTTLYSRLDALGLDLKNAARDDSNESK